MIKLAGIGHVLLRVADEKEAKRFYRDVLGFRVAKQDPKHGGVLMTRPRPPDNVGWVERSETHHPHVRTRQEWPFIDGTSLPAVLSSSPSISPTATAFKVASDAAQTSSYQHSL